MDINGYKYDTYESSTKGDYVHLRHKETGEEVILDITAGNQKRLAQGFLNKVRIEPYFLKHITLTQAKENYQPKFLNLFFSNMRCYYGKIVYIWTAEIQEKRLESTGEAVLHWHVIIGFPIDIEFGKEDVLRIQRYWKYGNVDIRPVRKPSMSYLMKYITKSLGDGYDKVRRIGSSQIKAYLRQGFNLLCDAIISFANMGAELDDFYWYRGNAFLYEDDKYKRGRIYIYRKPKRWEVVTRYSGDAF
ncbi:MAG: hypothetical protein HZB61_10785 [Nitrospirae bacterium]|nr:hypothetical protein [Nitrospirota bacterium]